MKILRYVAYVVLILYVVVSWANLPVPILNPPNAPLPYKWVLTYPASPPNIYNQANVILDITAEISASQTIADTVEVRVSAVACGDKAFVANLTNIMFGFIGAYWYPLCPQGYYFNSMAGVSLDPNIVGHPTDWFCPMTTANKTTFAGNASIVFRKPGDYPVTIQFQFANETVRDYTYPNFVLPVQSSETLRQGQINAGIGTATFAGFLFVVLDLYPKLREALDSPANRNAEYASNEDKNGDHSERYAVIL